MKLVEGWQKSVKWFSVQAMVLAGAIQGAWVFIPPEMKETIPVEWVSYLTMGLMVSGVFGRLVDQSS